MKTYLDCYPCFLRQALDAARRAGVPVEQQQEILRETMAALRALPADATPPRMAAGIHRMIRRQTGSADPYRRAKKAVTAQALTLYPVLKTRVRAAADPLDTAVRIAIAGNIIDLGVADSYDLGATLERVLVQPFAIDGLDALRRALAQAGEVLYLADNAGETVFDRVLVETLARPVSYVVKGAPVINDAVMEDALAAGLDEVATLVENGSDAPGTLLETCSEAFRERFDSARLIIAKGQANYETLSESDGPVFFLLQAKCGVIARDLGVEEGSVVLKPPAMAAGCA